MTTVLQSLSELLWQDHCAACAVMVPPGQSFCEGCLHSVDRLVASRTCPVCMDVDSPELCARCSATPPPFSKVVAGLEWGGAVKDAVHRLKFADSPWVAELLTRHAFPDVSVLPECDALVPVPLSAQRHRERGYNQARLLADELAGRLDVKVLHNCLRRARHTVAVADLAPLNRQEAVAGAFAVADGAAVAGLRLLLVDDVVTTSATVREACRMLREAGAASVSVVCVARGGTSGG